MNVTSWVDFDIERGPIYGSLKNKVGLKLTIHARPEIEYFMQGLSNGKVIPVESFSDGWIKIPADGNPLEAYAIETGFKSKDYSLTAIGAPLLFDDASLEEPRGLRVAAPASKDPKQIVNLSFLALSGISGENGLTIGIGGAFSANYILNARNKVPEQLKQFLHDYIVPMTIHLSVTQRL